MVLDFWYAVRALRKAPAFTLIAVATLALGIGANTAVFSLCDALLLRPLPYAEAGRLVALRPKSLSGAPDGERTSPATIADWQARARSFEAIAGYRWRTIDLTGGSHSERLHGLVVTPEYFTVFGVQHLFGRTFRTGDRGAPTIILGRDVWERRFESDHALVGALLNINTFNLTRVGPTPHLVLGVVPTDVYFPPLTTDFQLGVSEVDDRIQFWLPQFISSTDQRDDRVFDVVAKLRPGMTVDNAQADMDIVARDLAKEIPIGHADSGVRVIPLRTQVVGGAAPVVVSLSVCTLLVLLIACGNVSILLLVRGLARQREIAIRAVLGAGRLRTIRESLLEALIVALLAAVVGVAAAATVVAALRPWIPQGVPLIREVGINLTAVVFSILSAAASACVAAVVPAWWILRARTTTIDRHNISPARWHYRATDALVSAEVALTLVLLVSTGLLLKSAVRLGRVDPGFNPANVLTMTISLPHNKYEWRHNVVFSREVIRSVTSLPTIRNAAVIQGVPMRRGSFWSAFEPEGTPPVGPADLPIARLRVVSPGYFRVMSIPLIAGRDFDQRDDVGEVGHARFVIVNRTLADRYWPGANALGKRVRLGNPEWTTIAGVVGDVRYGGLDTPPGLEIYLPEGLYPQAAITLLVKTTTDPLRSSAGVRSRIAQVDHEAFVTDVRSMDDLISETLASRRFATLLLTVCAGIGLALALGGIYGVTAEAVVQRRLEIGIRAALGAAPARVVHLIVQQAMRPLALGMAIGIIATLAATRPLAGMLFDIRPLDLDTWVTALFLLVTASFVAALIPARRATSIDPAVTLRCD